MAIASGIFRQYDIRGIVGKDLTEEAALGVGRAYAAHLAELRLSGEVAVGRDNRPSGPMLRDALVDGLTGAGVSVVDIGVVPTPLNYWALHHLDVAGGIQITGSHNPPEYNGFKLSVGKGSLHGDAITHLYELTQRPAPAAKTRGKTRETAVIDRYIDDVMTRIGKLSRPIRAVYDCGNGAGALVAPELFKRLGLVGGGHGLFCESDGTFPNHHPDPTVETNLSDLKRIVVDKKLDFGIAFDGDGDRIGAVDGKGRVIWGDQLLAILAEPVLKEEPGATIIADVKASQVLFDRIAELGGKPLMWKTGHSLIKSKMKETGAPLAGEMSGHIFFRHRWYGFDDALYAAVRLIEAVSASGRSLTEIMDAMPRSTATPEMRFQVDEPRKFEIVDDVRDRLLAEGAILDTTDGVRVTTSDGWWLLRASNTQDVLVARAEAKDETGLERLVAQIDEQLEQSGVQRGEAVH